MATQGIFNGTNLNVYIMVVIPATDPIEYEDISVAHATSCEISFTHSAREVLTKDSGGDTQRLPGLRDWSLSCEALYANDYSEVTDRKGMTEIYASLKTGQKVKLKFSSAEVGDHEFEGEGFVDNISLNAGLEENASYSASFAGTGAIEMNELEAEPQE